MVGGRSREVALLGVFAHRAVGGEVRCQPRHAFPHPLDPCGRNAIRVAGIELRDHLAFKPVIQRCGFDRVPGRIIAMFLTISQRPPHFRRVGFRPPAVQFRKIDTAIDEHLHATRSAGLPRPAWSIQPDIDPLHQMLR